MFNTHNTQTTLVLHLQLGHLQFELWEIDVSSAAFQSSQQTKINTNKESFHLLAMKHLERYIDRRLFFCELKHVMSF